MAEAVKICPICSTTNHRNAAVCSTCGASLDAVPAADRYKSAGAHQVQYDYRYGETDLLESSARRPAQSIWLVFIVTVVLVLVLGLGYLIGAGATGGGVIPGDIAPVTFEPSPTLNVATVTQGPPTQTATFTPSATETPTITPTPAPCIQRIVAGGSLIGAIANCGHRSRDVLPTVIALNNIRDPNALQIGQEIIIPWPTETPDPNAVPEAAPTTEGQSSNTSSEASTIQINQDIVAFAPTPTATLPAGVMWHRVNAGENVVIIAVQYNANAKVLSELNPEIDFARCEFGERFGGPDCVVQLREGQMMRVPAPTPTPTLSPTIDPNSTATPTPTATANVPVAISPSDRAVFTADQLVTLRWAPSATLQAGEVYRVDVEDLTSGILYSALTTDIQFVLPLEWQGRSNQRHEFNWTVGITNQAAPDNVRMRTAPLSFVWQGIGEDS